MAERVSASGEREEDPVATLTVGDHDYRAFVGPPDQYDLMGATQFSLLYALGLRSDHRLLDIGCGSLRAGRLFISYLDPGGYAGLEPNKWLVDDAIEKQVGRDVLTIKTPTFVHNDQFDVTGLGEFDFIVAQSIASHTGPSLTKLFLRAVREGLAPTGTAAVTFIHSRRVDNANEGWIYPGCYRYRKETIDRWIREAGLQGVPIPWFHPRQTWWLLRPEGSKMPPRSFRWLARGETLAIKRSWNPATQPVNRLKESILRLLPPPLRPLAVKLRHAGVRAVRGHRRSSPRS